MVGGDENDLISVVRGSVGNRSEEFKTFGADFFSNNLYALSMYVYAALLGNNPTISTAELSALLPDFTQKHLIANQYCIFETKEELNQDTLNRLGGTILIAKQVTGNGVLTFADIPALLATELSTVKGKVVFSLRLVGIPPREGKDLFRACKNGLKKKGVPSRYTGNERESAKPIVLHDDGLLDPKKGCELTIIREKHLFWIGRTVAAQNVKAYTLRDIGKPVRDTTVGLLPPKLAQILLNLGEYLANENAKKALKSYVVFDPFCGTGVIPIEVLLRRNTILASDVSLKAVNGCEKNIEWTRKTYKILKKDAESVIWKQDATKPFDLKRHVPDIIVTEGSLGPALSDRPTIKEIETFMRDSDNLAAGFLKNCKASLPNVPIVMTLPVWYAMKKMIPLKKIAETIDACGYKTVMPPHVSGWLPDRLSLLYRRNDQFVGREIVLLMPKK